MERDGSWVSSRLRNGLQESVTVNTGRVDTGGNAFDRLCFSARQQQTLDVRRLGSPTFCKPLHSRSTSLAVTTRPDSRTALGSWRRRLDQTHLERAFFAWWTRAAHVHPRALVTAGPAWTHPQEVSRAVHCWSSLNPRGGLSTGSAIRSEYEVSCTCVRVDRRQMPKRVVRRLPRVLACRSRR